MNEIKKKLMSEFMVTMLQMEKEVCYRYMESKKSVYHCLTKRYNTSYVDVVRNKAIKIMDALCDIVNLPFIVKYY